MASGLGKAAISKGGKTAAGSIRNALRGCEKIKIVLFPVTVKHVSSVIGRCALTQKFS
jgi:hypothetical protein